MTSMHNSEKAIENGKAMFDGLFASSIVRCAA
jgi:hypothetical protein